jgi:hypothetical protein
MAEVREITRSAEFLASIVINSSGHAVCVVILRRIPGKICQRKYSDGMNRGAFPGKNSVAESSSIECQDQSRKEEQCEPGRKAANELALPSRSGGEGLLQV